MQAGHKEFLQFAGMFHQDIDLHDSLESFVDDALSTLSGPERLRLASFLQRSLGSLDEIDLERLWLSSGAEIAFADTKQLRLFLNGVAALVAK